MKQDEDSPQQKSNPKNELIHQNQRLRAEIDKLVKDMDTLIEKDTRPNNKFINSDIAKHVSQKKHSNNTLKAQIQRLKIKLSASDPKQALQERKEELGRSSKELNELQQKRRSLTEQSQQLEARKRQLVQKLNYNEQLQSLRHEILEGNEYIRGIDMKLKESQGRLKKKRDQLSVKLRDIKKLKNQISLRNKLLPAQKVSPSVLQSLWEQVQQLKQRRSHIQSTNAAKTKQLQEQLNELKQRKKRMQLQIEQRERVLQSNEIRINNLRRRVRERALEQLQDDQ